MLSATLAAKATILKKQIAVEVDQKCNRGLFLMALGEILRFIPVKTYSACCTNSS